MSAETTHLIADGEAVTSCCGRTPFELPRSERITVDAALSTCRDRPLLDQQAVADVVYSAVRAQGGPALASLVGTDVLGRLMELARPMPTREQIAAAIHRTHLNHQWDSPLCTGWCSEKHLRMADAVLALLSKGADR